MAEGTLRIRVVGDASNFQRTMDRTASRLQRVGGRMRDVGATATRRLSLPIAAVGGAALVTAANFESSMNRVRAVSGATGDDFQRLEGLARELGSTTQFSAGQAADAMGFLAQAGFETEDMMSALPGTLDLAAAGQLELAQAADIASNVLTGFGMEASEISRVNDVLAATASSANTNVEQMGEAFSLVAPVANSSGMAIEETSAVIGALGDAGIQASRAGTTMRGMIAALESPSAAAASAIEELGLRTHDAEGSLLPMVDIVGQLEDKGLSSADAMEIFGRRAGPGMAALVEQGSDRLSTLTGELENSGGTAERMADIQMEGLTGAIARLKSALEGAAIAIAESGLIDWAAGLAEKVAGLLQRLSEANPMLLRVGVIVAGVVAAIGPLLVVAGLMISSFGAIATAVGAISAPVIAVVAVIAGLAAGLIAAYQRSEEFRNVVQGAFEWFRNFVPQAIEFVRAAIDGFVAGMRAAWDRWGADIMAIARAAWDTIAAIVTRVVNDLRQVISVVTAAVQAIWERWGADIMEYARLTWNNIRQVIDGVLQVIRGIFEVFAGAFTGDWNRLWTGVKNIGAGIWNVIEGLVGQLLDTLSTIVSVGLRTIQDTWNSIWSAVKNFVSDRIDDVVGFVTDLPGRATSGLESQWETFASFWAGVWNAIKDFVSDRADDVRDFMADLPSRMFSAASNAWPTFWDWYTGVARAIYDFLSEKGEDLIDWFGDLPGKLADAMSTLGSKLRDMGREQWSNFTDWLGERGRALVDWFKGLPGRIGDALGDLGSTIKDKFSFDLPGINFSGDGPGGFTGPGGGGPAAARAAQASAGLPIVKTSGYRTPAQNRAAGGSPTSWHLDRSNPATDWAGPTWALDQFAARLRQMGGWRELLWRVPNHAPGDNPHVHVADEGATLDTGLNLLMNNTGRAEPLQRTDELRPLLEHISRQVGRPTIHQTFVSSGNVRDDAQAAKLALMR